jgi:hypothetical protein
VGFNIAIVASLPSFENDGEFYLALLDIKNRVARIALPEHFVPLSKAHDLPTLTDVG